MAPPAHKLVALLAVAAVGGGAGLAVGDLAEAKPRAKSRPAVRHARAVRVGTGQAWVPPGALGAQRAPLTGAAGTGGSTSGGAGAGPTSTAPGSAGTPAPATPTTTTDPPVPAAVGVTLDDRGAYSARLSRASVAAGQVVVQLNNQGEDQHNLRVVPTDHAGDPVDFPLTDPGRQSTRTLTLTPGRYYVFCTLTTPVNHAAAGMSATLEVTAAG